MPNGSDLDTEVAASRTRAVGAVSPIADFDGIVVHVRGVNGLGFCVALGVNIDGKKGLLGLWLSENEGAKPCFTSRLRFAKRFDTTNAIESVDGVIRQFIGNRKIYRPH